MSGQVLIVPWDGKPGQEFRNCWEDLMLVLAGVIDKAHMLLAEIRSWAQIRVDHLGPP